MSRGLPRTPLQPCASSEALLEHLGDTLLIILGLRHPEGLLVLHDVREHRATQEDHVLATRRVLDTQLELRRLLGMARSGESEALRANQSQSEALKGTPRRSEALRANQRHSEPIRGDQRHSEPIRGTQRHSEPIRGTQSQSEALRATPRRSEAQSEALREAVGGQARTCSGERGGESKWGGQSACMHTHLLLVALAI